SISWQSDKLDIPKLSVELDGELILEGDLETYFDRVLEKYPPEARRPVEAGIEDMSLLMESEEIRLLVVFESIEIGVDTTNNRKNHWFMLAGMYVMEK
ncbi:MAG TPA: hypothetical protein VFD79_08340, partial [Tissierellaceae bacterium]|nr:hypothetical protein [Tissierellaceae bacterium]